MNRFILRGSGIRSFSVYSPLQKTYGFIGLGRMGLSMAQNLRNNLPAGDELIVYDVNSTACKAIEGPIKIATSVSSLANDSEVVISVLPEGKHVAAVYNEIVDGHKPSEKSSKPSQKMFLDCSTIDVETSLKVAELLSTKNVGKFVDTPISGGTTGAKNATLTFMIGSDDLSEIQPILSHMGKRFFACGKPGMGLAAKLANNYVLGVTNIATAEAFQMANKLGLDLNLFSEIVNTSSGRSWSSEINNPVPGINPNTPSSRNYENGFGVKLLKKDVLLALDAAKLANLKLLLGDDAAQILQKIADSPEYGDKDMSIVYKWLEDGRGRD
jgi:3-hydroxyisobutyrate/3-hydroxypropionate dehydrogenase